MLTVDVGERADLAEICQHPWLSGEEIRLKHIAHKHDRLRLAGTIIVKPIAATSAGEPLDTMAPCGDVTDQEECGGEPPAKKKRSQSSGAVWYWKAQLSLPDDNPEAWQPYSDKDCAAIEKARARGAKSSKVGTSGEHRISFEGMFQYNTKDSSRQRPVRRIVPEG